MMHSIKLKPHIGSNDLLQIHSPKTWDTDIEVIIVYQTS